MAESNPYAVLWKDDKKAYMRQYYLVHKERIDKQNRANEPKYRQQKRNYARVHKEQVKISQDKWILANPDKVHDRAVKWQKNNKDKYKVIKRRAVLKANFGITPEQFDEMAVSQGYACAICRIVPQRTLHIDHDHKTGKVRGLLCSRCNTGIGLLKESTEFLANAIKYLSL